MARQFALIENSTVSNTIVADEWPGGIDIADMSPRPAPGWGYDGQAFTPPAEQPTPSLGTRITRLAFRQRLGQAALIGIELASIHNPAASAQAQQLAAMLRVMQADLISATYVDLSRADTRAGVQQLEAAGLIPPGHAAVVLDTPVSAVEVPLM